MDYIVIRFHSPEGDAAQLAPLAQEAEALAQKFHSSPSVEHAQVLSLLAYTRNSLADYERDLTAAGDEWLAAGGDSQDLFMGDIHYRMGQLRTSPGSYDEAEVHLQKAIAIVERSTRLDTSDLGFQYESLGLVETYVGKYDEGREQQQD